MADDAQREGPQPYRFAVRGDTTITPATHGSWDTLADGRARWRVAVQSQGASSLNLGFTRFALPAGAELTLAAPDGSDARGPYTSLDAVAGQLWTPVVRGDTTAIELTVPAAARDAVQLELTAVNYGFRAFWSEAKSGACNVDVVCPEGDAWRNQIRSVARFTINGEILCTGTMINNTAQDFTPYFLTANHCLSTAESAPTTVYYWNYQATTCGGSRNGRLTQTQSGAELVATNTKSDFTLLRLAQIPNPAFRVFYSGWDNRDVAPAGVTVIHHPAGDEKRISQDFDQTEVTDYLQPQTAPSSQTRPHWIRVVDWNVGTTEGGSSGSGLWNAEGRVVGQLTGGRAACGNEESDWFGRFNTAWFGGRTAGESVAAALDPAQSRVAVLDGSEPNRALEAPAPAAPVADAAFGAGGGFGWASLLLLALGGLVRARRQIVLP